MELVIKDNYKIEQRGEVYCIPNRHYTYKTSKNLIFDFYSGRSYLFLITDSQAIYDMTDEYIAIPLDEFCHYFKTADDDFKEKESRLEKEYTCLGERQNIYGVSIDSYKYRIFINAYPVKNEEGEWVLPKEGINIDKPMFHFDIGAFKGSDLMSQYPDTPILLGLTCKVNDLRKHGYQCDIDNQRYAQISELEYHLNFDLTFKDYFKCLKNRIKNYVFDWSCATGGRAKAFTLRFGDFGGKYLRLEYISFFDGSRIGFSAETNKYVWFFDIKHNGKWKPYFHKKENDHVYISC